MYRRKRVRDLKFNRLTKTQIGRDPKIYTLIPKGVCTYFGSIYLHVYIMDLAILLFDEVR